MNKWSFAVLSILSTSVFAQNLPPPTPVEDTPAPTVQQAPAPAAAPAAPTAPAATVEPAIQSTSAPSAHASNVPSHFRPDPISFNTRASAGVSFDPNAFWMIGDVEIQFDKFIAFGPRIQWGNNSTTDFFFGSLGPRFTLPLDFFEFGLHGGAGFSYRNISGFEFFNFLFETGVNLDFYILKNLSIGPSYTMNFLSTQAESFTSAFTFAVAGHF